VADRGVGRKIGFPTANLEVAAGKVLPRGVFVVRGWFENAPKRILVGVCNIGVRPTFLKGSAVSVEVHVFGVKGDWAGKTLFIELLHRLRSEKKFKSPAQLQKAIASDVRRAHAYLARYDGSN